METARKFTSADLLLMPDDGERYEVIEGELYVSRRPGFERLCAQPAHPLSARDEQDQRGVTLIAPGVVFGEGDDVAPDVVWVSRERAALKLAATLHAADALESPLPPASPA